MQPLNVFKFRTHQGSRETWGMETELLLNGEAIGRSIPGFALEAQYRCASGYLFVTSWDCGEDSLSIILTNEDLRVLDQASIGAMYHCTMLQSHDVLSENQVLLRVYCDADFVIRVTVDEGLSLHSTDDELRDFIPYPRDTLVEGTPVGDKVRTKPWWKVW